MTSIWEQPGPSEGSTDTGTYIPPGEAHADVGELPSTCAVALFGDSTVACSYFPPANRPENHLLVRLRRSFPDQHFEIVNLAGGESAAEGFRPERLEQIFAAIPRLHLAFARFNITGTDQEGLREHLDALEAGCQALRRHYPGITVILETGLWIHHPAHFVEDSHAHLGPLYDQMRAWAVEAGYPVVDIYQKMQAEAGKGNWDLRVRGLPTPEQTVVDDSFDEFFGEETIFFANIHPNSRCLALIAEWEVAMVKMLAKK